MKKILTLALAVSMVASGILPAAASTSSSTKSSGSSTAACSIDITSPASETINFYSSTKGSSAPAAKTVKVKNKGKNTVTLSQPSASSYTIGKLKDTKLSSGESTTFTVRPKSGLKSGSYNKNIKITATDGSSSSTDTLKVKYKVYSSLSSIISRFISTAKKYIGCKQGDSRHRDIVDTFNTVKPDGYPMTYTAPWCATFVSAIAIKVGLSADSFPMSYNCGTLITRAKKLGTWVENDNYMPSVGDYIIYYWSDSGYGDCKSGADHVGVVSGVSGSTFYVIEGNKSTSKSCGVRTMKRNGRYIRGFIKFSVKSSSTVSSGSSSSSSSSSAKVLAKGVVNVSGGVNVRSGAGTDYAVTGGLANGKSVKCYAVKTDDGYTWWAINSSKTEWIAAKYVKITKIYDSSKVTSSDSSSTTAKVLDTGVVTAKDGVTVRNGAGETYKKVSTLKYKASVKCYAKKTVDKVVWWAINSSKTKWVPTTNIKAASDTTDSSTTSKVLATGTVTAKNGVTVRNGAGETYKKVSTLKYKASVKCYAKKTVDKVVWWAINSSKTKWVPTTNIKAASDTTDSSTTSKVLATGTVTAKKGVTVMNGAGETYKKVSTLKYKASVKCYAKKTVDKVVWWAINSSKTKWVPTTDIKVATDSSSSTTSKVLASGTVTSKSGLIVRKGPGTSYKKVGSLEYKDSVKCYARKTVNKVTWWAINSSKTKWVCATYIKTSSSSTVLATGTVTSKSGLTVRKGAGTTYKKVGSLDYKASVKCYAKKTVNGVTWWAINSSKTKWVCAKYIKTSSSTSKTSSTTSSKGYTIKIVTSKSGVLVRKGPGTNYAKYDGGYDYKEKVRCYAEKNGWTAINKSHTKWICSKYLKDA